MCSVSNKTYYIANVFVCYCGNVFFASIRITITCHTLITRVSSESGHNANEIGECMCTQTSYPLDFSNALTFVINFWFWRNHIMRNDYPLYIKGVFFFPAVQSAVSASH